MDTPYSRITLPELVLLALMVFLVIPVTVAVCFVWEWVKK